MLAPRPVPAASWKVSCDPGPWGWLQLALSRKRPEQGTSVGRREPKSLCCSSGQAQPQHPSALCTSRGRRGRPSGALSLCAPLSGAGATEPGLPPPHPSAAQAGCLPPGTLRCSRARCPPSLALQQTPGPEPSEGPPKEPSEAPGCLRPPSRPGGQAPCPQGGLRSQCQAMPCSLPGRPEPSTDCLPQFLPWASFLGSGSGRGLSVCYLISILSRPFYQVSGLLGRNTLLFPTLPDTF